jgi:hypothetical protein
VPVPSSSSTVQCGSVPQEVFVLPRLLIDSASSFYSIKNLGICFAGTISLLVDIFSAFDELLHCLLKPVYCVEES